MKAFIIGTTFILAYAFFGSAAYANENGSNKGACFIPPPSPTGGGTLQRLQAIQRCDKFQSKERQMPSNSPMTQANPPTEVPSSIQQNQAPSSSMQPSMSC